MTEENLLSIMCRSRPGSISRKHIKILLFLFILQVACCGYKYNWKGRVILTQTAHSDRITLIQIWHWCHGSVITAGLGYHWDI